MTSWYFISLSFFVFTEYPLVICFGYYHCKLQKFICDIVIKFYFYHSINTSSNSDLLSRVYHTINRKTIPDAKKAGYHRHDDTLPLFFTNGSDLHCSCPVPSNRDGANGAPAGGAFLVDIPSRWKPRTKQQPTGLLFATPAAWPCCSRPVPPTTKNPQTEWSGDVVEHCPQQSNL